MESINNKKTEKKPLPKPGKRLTLDEAIEATNKQFPRTLARLAKPGKRQTFEEASDSIIKKYGEVFAKLAKSDGGS